MAKNKRDKTQAVQELDGVYFLKLVLYLIIGAQWLHVTNAAGQTTIAFPLGLLIGMAFALHDHFRIDRKIEFALLLVATMVGFYAQIGLNFSLWANTSNSIICNTLTGVRLSCYSNMVSFWETRLVY